MHQRFPAATLACIGMLVLPTYLAALPADPGRVAHDPMDEPAPVVGFENPVPVSKVLEDTVWIADWSFDGTSCNDTGWIKYDNRILNDGSNYWSLNTSFAAIGGITNRAAVLANHDLQWSRDGYGNNWDYSIVLKYLGASTLTFNYLSDSEPNFDFVTVEADSGGASESLVNYAVDPQATPSQFRTVLLTVDGVQNATAGPMALPDFSAPAVTHEVYIRFVSDAGYSDQDGAYPSNWNAGLVVDNISVAGGLNYSENFEGALGANVSLANTAPTTAFGEWARLYSHITDNDKCSENTTCAWLVTDPLRTAFFPDMAFGPGSAVIRNWLDDIWVSPWVSLASTPSASGTVLAFRTFPGNFFSRGRIVQNWSVRSTLRIDNTDTSTLGDSVDVLSPWGHAFDWIDLGVFRWASDGEEMSSFIASGSSEIQVRFRISDWQYIAGATPPATLDTGPGPFTDRIRIGRRVLTGPVFNIGLDSRSQGQDAFPTVLNSITPGEHFDPDGANRFGTCAFSSGGDLGINTSSPNLITGDSIFVEGITDVRGVGGISEVGWFGAITAGPHAGKAPAPYTVGAGGFFAVTPDSVRGPGGTVIENQYFVDVDDTYFRGGDQVRYFWTALDAAAGRSSSPSGIVAANFPPASVADAEVATGGLYEVSYLPTINWAQAYLDRIAADAHGDLEPTAEELAASSQQNCILYYNTFNPARPSGEANRTSFMYTLDRLGYRDFYDIYDVQGAGNVNNELGGRATVAQCSGYALIIQDDGRSSDLPDGIDIDAEKINQTDWYRSYLTAGLTSIAGSAALWIIGEDTAFEKQANSLLSTDFGLTAVANDQGLTVNPDVTGQNSFTFANGNVVPFAGDAFTLNGGCPNIRDYDGAMNGGASVMTHRYTTASATGTGAIIMNKNSVLKWSTIWMGFGWFDIRNSFNTSPVSGTGTPDIKLARKILNGVLPLACVHPENPTDVPDPETEAVPTVSALHPNVPNPFNPTTKIEFDLARDGRVRLQIFDVTGRLVRTLADGPQTRGFGKSVTWNGLDEVGHKVPSGVYFYRLTAGDVVATRKMVMLK